MDQPTPVDLDGHDHYKHDGLVYVIEFSDHTIKVGKTKNWLSRLRHHTGDASRFGLTVLRTACSTVHRNYHASERELIARAAASATRTFRHEYFQGASYSALAEYVDQLPARPSSAEEIAADRDSERSAGERARAWVEELFPPKYTVEVESEHARWVFTPLLTEGAKLPGIPGDSKATGLLIDALVTAKGIERDEAESMSMLDVLQHLAETYIEIGLHRLVIEAHSSERTDLTTPLGVLEQVRSFEESIDLEANR